MQEERFEQFAASITGIYRSIQKLKTRHAESLGLKTVHIFWLYLLREHPDGLYASQLAQASSSTRALVSREIDELARRGLITATGQTERRRYGWRFILTQSGREAADRIASIAASVQARADNGIPPEDLIVFYRTLRALQNNFDKLTDEQSV